MAIRLLAWIVALVSAAPPAASPAGSAADLRIEGATVYDSAGSAGTRASIVIRDGKILFAGDPARAKEISPKASTLAFPGAFVFPGWADAHGHLLGLGKALETAD